MTNRISLLFGLLFMTALGAPVLAEQREGRDEPRFQRARTETLAALGRARAAGSETKGVRQPVMDGYNDGEWPGVVGGGVRREARDAAKEQFPKASKDDFRSGARQAYGGEVPSGINQRRTRSIAVDAYQGRFPQGLPNGARGAANDVYRGPGKGLAKAGVSVAPPRAVGDGVIRQAGNQVFRSWREQNLATPGMLDRGRADGAGT